MYGKKKQYDIFRDGYKAVIKPRRDARMDRGSPERRVSVITFKRLSEREWSRVMGYGRRWSAETAFSTFKRLYGEYHMAKVWKTYIT